MESLLTWHNNNGLKIIIKKIKELLLGYNTSNVDFATIEGVRSAPVTRPQG